MRSAPAARESTAAAQKAPPGTPASGAYAKNPPSNEDGFSFHPIFQLEETGGVASSGGDAFPFEELAFQARLQNLIGLLEDDHVLLLHGSVHLHHDPIQDARANEGVQPGMPMARMLVTSPMAKPTTHTAMAMGFQFSTFAGNSPLARDCSSAGRLRFRMK